MGIAQSWAAGEQGPLCVKDWSGTWEQGGYEDRAFPTPHGASVRISKVSENRLGLSCARAPAGLASAVWAGFSPHHPMHLCREP